MLASGELMSRWRLVSIPILTGALLCLSCQREEKPQHTLARPPAPVVTAKAVQKEISLSIRGIGRVEAADTVSIRSKVEGEITKIHFQEGQQVREGDLLFSVDKRALRTLPQPGKGQGQQGSGPAEGTRGRRAEEKGHVVQGLHKPAAV